MPKLNDKYKPLYTSDKRYFILTGGRGSGKTFAVQDFLVRLLEQVGQGILYTRYTMTSVEKTILPLFVSYISEIADIKRYDITKDRIINLDTKSFIMFSGIKTSSGDQTGNLKSLPNITTWVIEEGEDYDKPDSFRDIDDSIRSKELQNRVIWIQNPTTIDHFIYGRFFKDTSVIDSSRGYEYLKSTHKEVEHIHTTYLDNKENLDDEKVGQWEKIKLTDIDLYNHKYLGGWLTQIEGAVFKSINSYKQIREEDVDMKLSYIDVATSGTDSLVHVTGSIIGNKIYITDVIKTADDTNISVPRCVEMTKRIQPNYTWVESNSAGGMFANVLNTECPNQQIIPFHNSTNKETRIISMEFFVSNYVYFRDDYEVGSEYDSFMREIKSYNKDKKLNKHDDSPDALTGLCSMLFKNFNYLYQ